MRNRIIKWDDHTILVDAITAVSAYNPGTGSFIVKLFGGEIEMFLDRRKTKEINQASVNLFIDLWKEQLQ